MDQNQKPLFVIDPNPMVEWPVIVKLPVDGGTFEEFQFSATFRVLSPDAYSALVQAPAPVTPVVADGKTTPAASPEPTMREVLRDNARQFAQMIVGWNGPVDANGVPVPFTQEALAAQVTGPRGGELSAALWVAIREIRTGSRLGNSAPLSVAG